LFRRLLPWLGKHAESGYDTFTADGNRQLKNHEFDAAVISFGKAVALEPHRSTAYVSLGYALKEAGNIDEAAQAFNDAIAKDSKNAEAFYFAGNIAHIRGGHSSAVPKLLIAIQLDKFLAPAYSEAALSLFQLGRFTEALTLMSNAVTLMPSNAMLHFAMGNLLAEATLYTEAVQSYKITLGLWPGLAEALANLGNCERHLGNIDQALLHLDAALKQQPNNAAWQSTRLFTLQYAGTFDCQALFEEHLKFADRFESQWLTSPVRSSFDSFNKDRRLRVGYVSGDFRQHSLLYFFEPVLTFRNSSRIEIFCYYTYPVSDIITDRLQKNSDHWRNCASLSDGELSDQIRADSIDVLIDLSGHTGHNRLLTFARKPAPIQMTWLGYQATTGLSAIDYRITDGAIDPPGQTEKYHTEKLLRLSRAASFEPDPRSPPVGRLPFVESAVFTYACLNNPAKITYDFIAVAAAILKHTENTRLMLGNANASNSAALVSAFASHGIYDNRLAFIPKLGMQEYLALHDQIDLALDTFPYNGGTTTMHSLWMGVPVLALDGESSISRVGAKIMQGLGLPKFACENKETFVERAIELARSPAYMQEIRALLRSRMSSVLVEQSKEFVQELECALIECAYEYSTNHAER